jgi:dTMP kinase
VSRGKFVTLEGIDGAGKSTHLSTVAELLRGRGKEVVVTREPGGTPLGEKLRALLLSEPMGIETETLLVFAARHEHIVRVIEPALAAGRWVISDRFTDATYAYQGRGGGLSAARISVLEQWVQGALRPDLTLFFDVAVEVAHSRLPKGPTDRFELQGQAFFDRVRAGYLARARAEPERVRILDANRSLSIVKEEVEKTMITIC